MRDSCGEHPSEGHRYILPQASQHQLGIVFPVAWTLAFFMRSETPVDVRSISSRGDDTVGAVRDYVDAGRGDNL